MNVHHFDAQTGLRLTRERGAFTLRPECQTHDYVLAECLHVEQSTYVLYDRDAPPTCYVAFRLRNKADRAMRLDSVASARIKRSFDDAIEAAWNERSHGLVVRSTGGRRVRTRVPFVAATRIVGGDGQARNLENRLRASFDGTIDAGIEDPLAVLHVRTRIEPRGEAAFWFALVRLPNGVKDLRRVRRRPADAGAALAATARRYEERLERTVMLSPVGDVDLGVRWAKANMLRVMRWAPTGRGFTNDPGRSSSCVGRDSAWFVHGCDWLDPDFSSALLRGFAQRQEPDGKIVEYYDLRTGETCDDGLNVNDNTPLFAIAVWHHALATGDRGFLEELYPAARRAVDQLLANRDARGLVYCTARGTGARGIAGWRNIIKGYRISGATTELNSEAYAALNRVATLAAMLGKEADAEHYIAQAGALRAAVERHLRNPGNGLYYLNLSVDGHARDVLSSDLLFPVIFGISDPDTSARIVERLREVDFWTDAGVRTVSRDAAEYVPWPERTARRRLGRRYVLVRVRGRSFLSRFHGASLQKTFEYYAEDPSANNTVPGEFSEWLHGETLVNQGMMLSPWFPPRYLWAAIEGACGLQPTEKEHGSHRACRRTGPGSQRAKCRFGANRSPGSRRVRTADYESTRRERSIVPRRSKRTNATLLARFTRQGKTSPSSGSRAEARLPSSSATGRLIRYASRFVSKERSRENGPNARTITSSADGKTMTGPTTKPMARRSRAAASASSSSSDGRIRDAPTLRSSTTTQRAPPCLRRST